MPGKVFISCGQRDDEERAVAGQIADWFSSRGFDPYVAIQTQSFQDVTGGIIGNLRAADFYVFVDCRRELVPVDKCGQAQYRGSLFTNQELAIALALGLDNAVFVQQEGVLLEGMAKYLLANARKFDILAEVPEMIKQEVNARKWSPQYSRHLVVAKLRDPFDLPPEQPQRRHWEVDIENRRPDKAAVNATARLIKIESPDRTWDSPDPSDLKWAKQPGFSRTIRPNGFETVDVLFQDLRNPGDFHLISAIDVFPKKPVLSAARGIHRLRYDVYSEGFPPLEFVLQLNATGDLSTTVDLAENA